LISEQDLQIYRNKIPNLIEVAQIRKKARNNAAEAFLILSNTKQFTTIQGDERRELISEFGTLSKQQADVTSALLNQSIIEKSKQFMEKYGDKEKFGFTPEELEEFKTGNEETDNQIVILNEKMVNKEFSFDTNYNINTDVISKIVSGEIQNTSTKFLLSGETEPKSILERAGNKTINDNDFKFLSDVITRNKNNTFKKQDQQFLKYFENLVPLLQGNTFLNYFDKEYNAKASELRQTLHSRYLNGLAQGANPTDLLSYTSENYIAKDIKNFLPKTSDLSSIVIEMAAENNQTIDGPPRLEGETAEEYLNRIQKEEKKIDVGDEDSPDLSASLDVTPRLASMKKKVGQGSITFKKFADNANMNNAYNSLRVRLNPKASAALLGNIYAENDTFEFNREEAGDINELKDGQRGYGIFQFTNYKNKKGEIVGHRKEYFNYLQNTGKKDSIQSQVDYVLDNIYKGIGLDIGAGHRETLRESFKNDSVKEITAKFMEIFERPDKEKQKLDKRSNFALEAYEHFSTIQNIS
jgi:hypothetical protein